MERQRDEGLDMMRVLASMAVLGGHMISHGGMLAGAGVGTLNSFVCAFLLGAFMSLTNFFGMMSGYLLCKSRFKLRRILSIWLQVVFYSVLFTVPRLFYARGEVGLQEFVSMFLPVTCKRVWYVSCYVAVVLLAPFINRLLRALSRRQHLLLALVLLGLFSVSVTVGYNYDAYGIGPMGHDVVWMTMMYVVGAYFRLYPRRCEHRGRLWAISLCMMILVAFSHDAMIMAGFSSRNMWLLNFTSPPQIISAICLFLLVQGKRLRSRRLARLLAWMAPLSFGVFLAHLQPVAWEVGKGCLNWLGKLPLHVMAGVYLAILLVGFAALLLLEFVRVKLFALLRIDRGVLALEARIMRAQTRFVDRIERL